MITTIPTLALHLGWGTTLAIKTIRNHVNTMHSIFEIAMRRGWCQRNPVKLAERPSRETTRGERPARNR